MKKNMVIIVAIILFITILGFATNPSHAEYKEWFKAELYKEMENKTQIEKSIYGFVADFISDAGVIREDHKLYSIYTIDDSGIKLKVLGAFNNFYILEDVEIANEESQE